MKAQGYGRFVFIASQMGAFGQDDNAAYGAAKAGLIGLTNVVAIEGASHGILANSVLPIGYTRMVTESIGDRRLSEIEEAFFKSIEPERVVPLVVFFASRACEVTHHNVSAAAGRFARAFMALSHGWLADPSGPVPTADDVAAQLCRHLSDRELHDPDVFLRGDHRSLRASRPHLIAGAARPLAASHRTVAVSAARWPRSVPGRRGGVRRARQVACPCSAGLR